MRVIGTSGRLDTPGCRGLIEPSPSSSWDEVQKLAPVAAVCCRAPPIRCWPEKPESHRRDFSVLKTFRYSRPARYFRPLGESPPHILARLAIQFSKSVLLVQFLTFPQGNTPETKPGPFLLFRAGHRARAAGWPQAFNAVTRIQVEDFCRQDDCYRLRDFVLLQPVKPDSIANVRQHFAGIIHFTKHHSTKHCPCHLLARVAHRIPSTKERQATFKKICNDCVLWPKTCPCRPTLVAKQRAGICFRMSLAGP